MRKSMMIAAGLGMVWGLAAAWTWADASNATKTPSAGPPTTQPAKPGPVQPAALSTNRSEQSESAIKPASLNEQGQRKTEATKTEPGVTSRAAQDRHALTAEERIAGFVRLWSEIRYNFAFFEKVPDLNWDKTLEEYLPKVSRPQSTEDYYRLLQRCVAALRDGHTSVYPPSSPADRGRLPFRLEMIGEKVIITGVAPAASYATPKRAPGLEITHIDGRAVAEILDQDIYPRVAASTVQDRDRRAVCELVVGEEGSVAAVRFRDLHARTSDVRVARLQAWQFPDIPRFEMCDLGQGIVYVAMNTFGDRTFGSQFEAALKTISKPRGLIIDVRDNGGGSSSVGYAVISQLIDKPLQSSRWKTRQYMPAFRAWGRKEAWHEEQPHAINPSKEAPFLGPVVVLTSPGTVSAAEDFVVALKAGRRATIIGRKTAGTTGQPLLIKLPGGGSARICTKWDSSPDGTEFVGVGVIPDVEVGPTQQSITDGKDPELDKAIEVLTGKLGIDAYGLSFDAVRKRRDRLAGKDDPLILAEMFKAAKAEYDALVAAYGKQDIPSVGNHSEALRDVLRRGLLPAARLDRLDALRKDKGQWDQQAEYVHCRLEELRRQIKSMSGDEKDFARICQLIVDVEDAADEIHDCIRDSRLQRIPDQFNRLTRLWPEFWKLSSKVPR